LTEQEDVEPDAIEIICQNHCQKRGVNLYEDGEHIGESYADGKRKSTTKPNIGCNVKRNPLFSQSTIQDKIEEIEDKYKDGSEPMAVEMAREKFIEELKEVFQQQ